MIDIPNVITIRVSVGQPLRDQVRDCKRQLVLHALTAVTSSVPRAATRLGLERSALHRVMRELQIERVSSVGHRRRGPDPVADDLADMEARLRAREAAGAR